jgi:peptide/nickel transport system ATP-binding protein
MAMDAPLLKVSGLKRHFDVSPPWLSRMVERKSRRLLKAVDGVSFEVARGKTFSLVGESGCGKSTVAKCILGLYGMTAGTITFDGVDVHDTASRTAMLPIRRRLQMIFQDPYASLNPRWKVRSIVDEPIRAFRQLRDRSTVLHQVEELLRAVGLTPADAERYPHEFSGEQRQRISIARALASRADFIACDEPTSALDVSVQAQILNLMKDLQTEFGLTYLLISHNLAVVRHMSDSVGVMYLGRLVEVRHGDALFDDPRHPYTRLLLNAIPSLEIIGQDRTPLAGEVPSPINPPTGCHFHPRCPHANQRCREESPVLLPVPSGEVACHAVEEGRN